MAWPSGKIFLDSHSDQSIILKLQATRVFCYSSIIRLIFPIELVDLMTQFPKNCNKVLAQNFLLIKKLNNCDELIDFSVEINRIIRRIMRPGKVFDGKITEKLLQRVKRQSDETMNELVT